METCWMSLLRLSVQSLSCVAQLSSFNLVLMMQNDSMWVFFTLSYKKRVQHRIKPVYLFYAAQLGKKGKSSLRAKIKLNVNKACFLRNLQSKLSVLVV